MPESALDRYLDFRSRIGREADVLFERYATHLTCRRGCYYCCDEITVLPVELEALRRHLFRTGTPPPETRGGPPADSGETPEAIRERDERSRQSVDRSVYGTFSSPYGTFPVASGTFPQARGTGPGQDGRRRRCAFLGRAGECTVYEARPVICRTHGLPLAYRVYEYDLHGREVRPDRPEYTDLWCDLNFATLADEQALTLFDRDGRINMDRANLTIEALNEEFLRSPDGAPYRDLTPGEDRQPLGVLLEPGRIRAGTTSPAGNDR